MLNNLKKLKELLKNNNKISNNENKKVIEIANLLNLDFKEHKLTKLDFNFINAFEISDDNMIFLYPINDGRPTCSFAFYKDGKLIIDNRTNYSEITNLDEIILQIVKIYIEVIKNKIVIDPYYFMLKLDDEVKPNYKGSATLVITEKAIRNHKLNNQNFDEAEKYFVNRFLDQFIGWNFGVSINKNKMLENALNYLNRMVIEKGIREDAGTGFEVYGTDTEESNGLQHYYLPSELNSVKKKTM